MWAVLKGVDEEAEQYESAKAKSGVEGLGSEGRPPTILMYDITLMLKPKLTMWAAREISWTQVVPMGKNTPARAADAGVPTANVVAAPSWGESTEGNLTADDMYDARMTVAMERQAASNKRQVWAMEHLVVVINRHTKATKEFAAEIQRWPVWTSWHTPHPPQLSSGRGGQSTSAQSTKQEQVLAREDEMRRVQRTNPIRIHS
ncbi:hypothetical protein EDC04DRAFT_2601917 [Pisolithus marmoratus]|nr:hypothetical protein EDC04DRAFT_2601917 [Pisolithus marmoratus]